MGNVRAQKRRYSTIAYRFFRDVHVKHVRTTSNMMSRQWSAAKCGDDDGRRSSAASLTYAIYETRTSGFGFIFLFLANCSLFHSRDDDGGGRVSAKINSKTRARPLPAVMIISRARQHAHTHDDGGGGSNRGYSDISGSIVVVKVVVMML